MEGTARQSRGKKKGQKDKEKNSQYNPMKKDKEKKRRRAKQTNIAAGDGGRSRPRDTQTLFRPKKGHTENLNSETVIVLAY